MSVAQTATKSLDLIAAALHGLDTISELAKGKIHDTDRAIELLSLIATVIDRIRDGFDGKIDAKEIRDGFLKMRTDLMENDVEVAADVDKKFPR